MKSSPAAELPASDDRLEDQMLSDAIEALTHDNTLAREKLPF